MKNGRVTSEATSSYLEQQQQHKFPREGMSLTRSASAPSGGSGNFSVDNQFGYRWGELGVGGFTPSPPALSPWRSTPHSASKYEGTMGWKQSPSSAGSRNRTNRCRNYGVSYKRANNELIRTYSARSYSVGEEDHSYPLDEGKGGPSTPRSRSPLTLAPGSSYIAFQTPSPRNNGRAAGSSTSSRGSSKPVKFHAEIPPLLASALSEAQASRVHASLQNSTTVSQSGVRLKILEFLEYWMSDALTCVAIEQLITEAYHEAQVDDSRGTPVIENEKDFPRENSNVTNGVRGVEGDNRRHVQDSDNVNDSRVGISPVVLSSSSLTSSSLSLLSSTSSLSSKILVPHHSDSRNWNKEAVMEKQRQQEKEKEEESQSDLEGGRNKFVKKNKDLDANATSSQNQDFPVDRFVNMDSVSMTPPPSTTSPSRFYGLTSASSPSATYDAIPRFYFPNGLRQEPEERLVGLVCKKHENPHLKGVEGMVIPKAVYATYEDHAVRMNSGLSKGRKVKRASITSLKAVEDKNVLPFIQREFSHLPALPKSSQGTKFMNVRTKGFLGIAQIAQTRQGINYKSQLNRAIQRVCTECFGLPKYFAFLIVIILQANVVPGNTGMNSGENSYSAALNMSSSTNGGLLLSSSSLLSPSGLSSNSQSDVMVQQLYDFFETYLRGRCIVRRVFELLLLSSRLVSVGSEKSFTIGGSLQRNMSDVDEGKERSYLLPNDFRAYIEVLLEHHPGLVFLKSTPEFQSKYLETVIYRIFYDLDRFGRGRITYAEMESSPFVDSLRQVDASNDINSVLLYFSYEHFYVLYCRFWELDEDRDMLLSRRDFMKYTPEGLMNTIVADRVFSGVGHRAPMRRKNRINYEEFVWFCLSEEDKTTPTAIRYWFRILDLDGDGVLSAYELRHFYDVTKETVRLYVPDGTVPFEDVLCQIFDMFDIEAPFGLWLEDLLLKPEAAAVAFSMITNVVQFLQYEQRDPFVAHQDRVECGLEQTPWDRFARAEYDRLSQAVKNE